MNYPDRWHPCYFLENSLRELDAQAQVIRDERTEGCWGLLVNGKVMVWFIDNRWDHEKAKEDPAAERLLSRGALVCHAQKPDMERVGGRWLPLAASPGFTYNELPKTHDCAFVGTVRDATRASVLTDVAAHVSLCVKEGVFGIEAVDAYQRASVGLNVVTNAFHPDAYDSANMRLFEIMATGTPLLTPYQPYLHELGVQCGINCYTYYDVSEIVPLVKSIVNDQRGAEIAGLKGARLIQERHLYSHRAKTVLEWLT